MRKRGRSSGLPGAERICQATLLRVRVLLFQSAKRGDFFRPICRARPGIEHAVWGGDSARAVPVSIATGWICRRLNMQQIGAGCE